MGDITIYCLIRSVCILSYHHTSPRNDERHALPIFEPTQDQILELLQEAAEIQDNQRQQEVRQTFFGDLFPEGHTDAAYDACKNANVHDGIWN